MSGAGHELKHRWTFSIRAIANQIPRASVRTTLTFAFHQRLSAGIEYNPRADQVSPLANLLVIPESLRRPALIVGTSSDRIGTPEGQSFYATFSKNLRRETRLPIAPYVGAAYGTYEDRWRAIGGLSIGFTERSSALVVFDGVHAHPTLTYAYRRNVFTLLLIRGRDPGVSYSFTF